MELFSVNNAMLKRFFILLALSTVGISSRAQSLKEVEIEVAGPWSYVPDPRPGASGRIIIVAPIVAVAPHKVDLHSGGNAYVFPGDITAGLYNLDFNFNAANCSQPRPAKLLALQTVHASSSLITNVINDKGNRYAISLPKPCYFETYQDARSIVSTAPITDSSAEQRYTTWMKLHYTVENTLTQANFSGKSDASGNNPLPNPISFARDSHPPKSEAITVVLYDDTDNEEYDCDLHSQEYFDASVVHQWAQTGEYRLFPELDAGHFQTSTYNYDQKICNQVPGKQSRAAHAHNRVWFKDQIDLIRRALESSDVTRADNALNQLREALAGLLGDPLPSGIMEDLQAVTQISMTLKKKDEKLQVVNANQYLRVTENILTAGRADCHSMQINVNGIVN